MGPSFVGSENSKKTISEAQQFLHLISHPILFDFIREKPGEYQPTEGIPGHKINKSI